MAVQLERMHHEVSKTHLNYRCQDSHHESGRGSQEGKEKTRVMKGKIVMKREEKRET